jgi:hypothetical protein
MARKYTESSPPVTTICGPFAVRPTQQLPGNKHVDRLDRAPVDQRWQCRVLQDLALPLRQVLRAVAALVLKQMPQVFIGKQAK